MDKAHNISLGGFSFVIEEKAYQELSQYLNNVRKFLGDTPDTEEIIYDIEQRMAELLKNQMKGREVIESQDISYLIEVLGTPEQYTIDDDQTNDATTSKSDTSTLGRMNNLLKNRKLYRDIDGKKLAGVLSGFSYYINVDVTWVRIIYILLFLSVPSSLMFADTFKSFMPLASGTWFVFYIVFWAVVPAAKTSAEKLEMQGKSVNIDTLSSFKNERTTNKKLYKNTQNKMFLGVLSGLSEYFSIDTSLLRIVFILVVLGIIPILEGRISGILFVLYFILYIALPEKKLSQNNNFQTENSADFQNDNSETNINVSDLSIKNESSQGTSIQKGCWVFIRAIFKGIFYLLVGFVTFILAIILISLILSLFGVGIAGWGIGVSALAASDYLPYLVSNDGYLWLAYLSIFSLFFLPISIVTILVFKLLSKDGYRTPRAWVLLNVLCFFLGVMGNFFVITNILKNFQTDNYVEEKIYFDTQADTISLSYQETPSGNIYEYSIINFYDLFLKDEGEIIRKGEERFVVRETSENKPYILLQKHSRGRNLTDAKERATQIKYDLRIEGASVTMPAKFSLGKNPKIRDQRVKVFVYLPQGMNITSPSEELSVLEERTNTWINISRNGVAKMTANGLEKIQP